MQTDIYIAVKKVADKYGLPMEVVYPIIMSESSGNPNSQTVTSREDSRGLFQVNTFAHPDADKSKLFDPTYNAEYQIPKLVPWYKKAVAQGLTGVDVVHYVERYGQRPQWTETVKNNLTKYYNLFTKVSGEVAEESGKTPSTPSPNTGGNIGGIGNSLTPTSFLEKLGTNIRYYAVVITIFLLIIFSFYMVFVYKGGK